MSYYLHPDKGTDNLHSLILTVLCKIKVNKNIIIYKLGFQPSSSDISVSARIYDATGNLIAKGSTVGYENVPPYSYSYSVFDKPIILLKDTVYYIGEYGQSVGMYNTTITQLEDDRITIDFLSGGCYSSGDSFPSSKQSYYTIFSGLRENISFNYSPAFFECLIKQNDQYYNVKDNVLQLLGIPTDDTQKEEWFNDYGVYNLGEVLLTPDENGNKLIDSLNDKFEVRMMVPKS